jgi:nucleoside-diphosphate-sugar epimerase
MKILVTGAAGKLGSVVCQSLLDGGHELCATDQRFRRDFPVRLELADLRDELRVYALVEGSDAVVHLGNHPNLFSGPSPQRILADNVAMNANVFRAAVDLGVPKIVFASSIQATFCMHEGTRPEPPYQIPYLPLDGELPANPGTNFYGLSKELGERLLEVHAKRYRELSCTALRFPILANDWWLRRMGAETGRAKRDWLSFGEGLAYLLLPEAAAVVRAVVEKQTPGYHQYFPASSIRIRNFALPELIEQFYPGVPLRRPLTEITALIDTSAITRAVGWAPTQSLAVDLE